MEITFPVWSTASYDTVSSKPLHHRMQAASTDVLRPLIYMKRNFSNTLHAIVRERNLDAFCAHQCLVLRGERCVRLCEDTNEVTDLE